MDAFFAFYSPISSSSTALLGTAQSPSTKSYIFSIATPHNRCRTGIAATPAKREMDHLLCAELLKVFSVNVLMVEYRSTPRWSKILRGIHHG